MSDPPNTLFNDGLTLDDIALSCGMSLEAVVADLTGTSLLHDQAEAIKDLRIEFVAKSPCDISLRRRLSSVALKLSQLLTSDYRGVAAVLKKNLARQLAKSDSVVLYDYRTRLYIIDASSQLKCVSLPALHQERFRYRNRGYSEMGWAELPDLSLVVTGGATDNAWGLGDPTAICKQFQHLRDFAEVEKPAMLRARRSHYSFYHNDFIYAISGASTAVLAKCERLHVLGEVWTDIPDIPKATCMQAWAFIDKTETLYAIGNSKTGLVQALHLDRLEWTCLHTKVPYFEFAFHRPSYPDAVFLVTGRYLYRLDLATDEVTIDRKLSLVYNGRRTFCMYLRGSLVLSQASPYPQIYEIGLG
jgi:hypothetical protein